ncbi:hypothetical protein PG984_005093 [Apiospora sp. TS-2023a]
MSLDRPPLFTAANKLHDGDRGYSQNESPEFSLFPKLPVELQLEIWDHAAAQPRFFQMRLRMTRRTYKWIYDCKPLDSPLSTACRASRKAFLRFWCTSTITNPSHLGITNDKGDKTWYRPQLDVMVLGPSVGMGCHFNMPGAREIQHLALDYDFAHEVLRDFISNRLAFSRERGKMPRAFPNLRTFQIYADWIGPGLEPSDRPAKDRVDETTTTTTRDLSSPTTENYAYWIDLLERYADGYQMSGPGILLLTGHQIWARQLTAKSYLSPRTAFFDTVPALHQLAQRDPTLGLGTRRSRARSPSPGQAPHPSLKVGPPHRVHRVPGRLPEVDALRPGTHTPFRQGRVPEGPQVASGPRPRRPRGDRLALARQVGRPTPHPRGQRDPAPGDPRPLPFRDPQSIQVGPIGVRQGALGKAADPLLPAPAYLGGARGMDRLAGQAGRRRPPADGPGHRLDPVVPRSAAPDVRPTAGDAGPVPQRLLWT